LVTAREEHPEEPFRDALLRAVDTIQGRTVTLRELIDLIGEQGLLFLCALLTLPFLIPVSIPGVSTVFGAAIILISIAIASNRTPWLPKRIMDRPIETEKLVSALRRGADIVRSVERFVRPRLTGLATGALIERVNGLGLTAGGVLLMFPLGLVPFSNTLPALAILFLAVGISQRDGVFVLGGYVMLVLTVIYFAVLAWAAFAAGQGLASFFGA
jgi:hypothetical protein